MCRSFKRFQRLKIRSYIRHATELSNVVLDNNLTSSTVSTSFIQKYKLEPLLAELHNTNMSNMMPSPTSQHAPVSTDSPTDPMLKLRDLLSSMQSPASAAQNSKKDGGEPSVITDNVPLHVFKKEENNHAISSSKKLPSRMQSQSVLKYGDSIILRSMSCYQNINCLVPNGSGKQVADSELYQAEVEGLGLGGRQSSEILVFESVKPLAASDEQFIRYNDTVIIRSPAADYQALSVHNAVALEKGGEKESIGTDRPLVGFYRTWTGYSEKFTIIPSDFEADNFVSIDHDQSSSVCIGDVILLRSASTGDILKVSQTCTSANKNILQLGRFENEMEDINLCGRFQIGKSNQALNPAWLVNMSKCTHYLYDGYLEKGYYNNSIGELRLPENFSDQECLIVENLIDALMGFPGRIFASRLDYSFHISDKVQNIDISLAHLSQRILPLCTYFLQIDSFISARMTNYEYGLVAQALASEMYNFIQEYLILVNQFEAFQNDDSKRLTLQKIWCFVQPSLSTMSTLVSVVKATSHLKGGALLNAIGTKLNCTADEQESKILQHLLNSSSIPYFKMLSNWIYSGNLNDIYEEFMIYDNTENVKNEDTSIWWANQFKLREENVLDIFRSVTSTISHVKNTLPEKVLTTGKYLNVIRACNQCLIDDNLANGTVDISEGILSVHSKIQSAFTASSSMLLSLLFNEHELIHKMRSIIKRYFLLHHQGPDFFTQFLDAAESELLQEVDEISTDRIKSLLTMAGHSHILLDSNGQQVDLFREDFLYFDFAPLSLIDHLDALHSISGGLQLNDVTKSTIKEIDERILNASRHAAPLTGIEAFTLDFRANSLPLSLMISRRAITNYQLIFRHLFFCKHVERRLFSTWLDHQMVKELNLRGLLGRTYCLRQRMLHFLQNFVYYMMFEVIEPRWVEFENNLLASKNIDEAMYVHEEFQHTVMKECLLTNQGLLKVLAKLMSTCLLFSEQMKRFFDSTDVDKDFGESATNERLKRFNIERNLTYKIEEQKIAKATVERQNRLDDLTMRLKHELNKPSYTLMITKFHQVFDSLLGDFMEELEQDANANYHSHLSNLAVRLDYNQYYTSRQ